jgi:hypothetical protein
MYANRALAPTGQASVLNKQSKSAVSHNRCNARQARCIAKPVRPARGTCALPLMARTQSASRGLAVQVKASATAVVAPDSAQGCPRGADWQVHKFGGTCMSTAERMRAAAKLVIDDPSPGKVVVVSAMGSHPSNPVKVTDLILNMISKAARQDAGFLVDLAALQEKHVESAKQLLGDSPELTKFVARLLDDIGNLKAMLQAICIGTPPPRGTCACVP